SNYVKDQINYSRSYWFSFLPFYHMGARVSYAPNDAVTLNYWITNGTQQTEAFNNFKDQFGGIVLQPTKSVTWNVQYYLGQEHPAGKPIQTPGGPTIPTQPGPSINDGLPPAPDMKAYGGAAYVRRQLTDRTAIAGRAEYVRDQGGLFSGATQSLGETT